MTSLTNSKQYGSTRRRGSLGPSSRASDRYGSVVTCAMRRVPPYCFEFMYLLSVEKSVEKYVYMLVGMMWEKCGKVGSSFRKWRNCGKVVGCSHFLHKNVHMFCTFSLAFLPLLSGGICTVST